MSFCNLEYDINEGKKQQQHNLGQATFKMLPVLFQVTRIITTVVWQQWPNDYNTILQ